MNTMIIEQLLRELNIPVEYMKYDGYEDIYIVYSIYDSQNTNLFDDEYESKEFLIAINIWTRDKIGLKIVEKVRTILINNGFIENGERSLVDNEFYGYNLDFIYEMENEED